MASKKEKKVFPIGFSDNSIDIQLSKFVGIFNFLLSTSMYAFKPYSWGKKNQHNYNREITYGIYFKI